MTINVAITDDHEIVRVGLQHTGDSTNEEPQDNTTPVTDTTDVNNKLGGGGCSVAHDGSGNLDSLLLLFTSLLLHRRTKRLLWP